MVQITFVDINQPCFLTSSDLKSCRDRDGATSCYKSPEQDAGEETPAAAFCVVTFIGMTRGCRSRCVLLLKFQFGEETQQAEGEHSDTIRKEIHE